MSQDLEVELDFDAPVPSDGKPRLWGEPPAGKEIHPDTIRVPSSALDPPPAQLNEVPNLFMVARALPADFPLVRLLQFLPDVSLKRAADSEAEAALAIDVASDQGLVAADAATARLRERVEQIDRCFDGDDENPGPTKLAYALHKRLTGLRAEFCKAASGAISVLTRRIYEEKQRRDREAEAARRKAQEAADRAAREEAKRIAEEAKRTGADKSIVAALKKEAKTATAPPVASPIQAPALAHNATVAKWKARFKGTPPTAESNPKVNELNAAQREQFLRLCLAVGHGQAPMALLEIDWGYANRRAVSDKTTFDIPELEAFDEGGTRSKGRR